MRTHSIFSDTQICAGVERRPHRLLAIAAVADADIERLALGLEPYRAAQASAFPDGAHVSRSRGRRKCRTRHRSRTRNLPTPARPPWLRVLPPARSAPSGSSTA